jgi:NADH-quinone oxidoreductase subunit C
MTQMHEDVLAYAREKFGDAVTSSRVSLGELTLEIARDRVVDVCRTLRDDARLNYEQLIDLCGIDYLDYAKESWGAPRPAARFAVVYHLLSVKHNRRVRLRVLLDDELPIAPSVTTVWNSANWYEREAFDLFGIVFEGHPDLRRILTDYGFVGHPFRKDFPLIGQVEMRYDPEKGRVIYQPVSIEARVNVPRVIRQEGFGRG